MTPQQYVQDKAARSGSSFYYAFLFLPPPRRAAITAFYAFCREVDDVVDEVADPAVAATKLRWWRQEVSQAFDGRPSHPVMHALMPLSADFGIEARHLQAVIDGCQIDLEQTRFLDYPASLIEHLTDTVLSPFFFFRHISHHPPITGSSRCACKRDFLPPRSLLRRQDAFV